MKNFLSNAFIAPFASQKLSRPYMAILINGIGGSFFEIFVTLNLAALSMMDLAIYLFLRLAVPALIGHPFIAYLYRIFGYSKTAKGLFLAQIIALIVMILAVGSAISPLMAGFIFTLIYLPFWQNYHSLMTLKMSDKNRGNETSLASIINKFGVLMGVFFAGICVEYDLLQTAQWLIIITSTLSAYLVMSGLVDIAKAQTSAPTAIIPATSRQDIRNAIAATTRRFRDLLTTSPMRNASTICFGAHQTISEMLLPLWLFLSGYSAIETGGIIAVILLLKTILSPLIGHLTNLGISKDNAHDVRSGTILKIIGWIPFLFIQHPAVLVWSILFWSIGSHFHDTGLVSRWYKNRSPEAVTGREICLGIGRSLSAIACLWSLFYSLESYAIIGIIIASLSFCASYLPRNR